MTTDKTIDIICVGELLIDFISTDFAEDFSQVHHFKRMPGGSPANLSMNLSRLGKQAILIACVGEDNMGNYLRNYCGGLGLDVRYIHRLTDAPTTLILVTRSKEVSSFEAYRMADAQIRPEFLPMSLLSSTKLFHTTCFALSREPARSSILEAAAKVVDAGGQLSIDANYAPKIWPNQQEAQQIMQAYCRQSALVKISEVDWERLYGQPLADPQAALDHFLALGASEVCVTLGGEGCWVADAREALFLEARSVEVKDTTGAGDAFWSGYLSAWLDQKSLRDKALTARSMAELKLTHFGPLPPKVDLLVDEEPA
ncbi:MAG: PfkB family carbohydrate kinase [Bacteroidota bacterium]